jgi:uncharacterized protein
MLVFRVVRRTCYSGPDGFLAGVRDLIWMRDQLGARFIGGVVLHAGPRAFPPGDRVRALPISTIWAAL